MEFWFGYGSTYTYLTVMRIEPLARSRGVTVRWKPIKLVSLMRDLGLPKGPFLERPEKLAYMYRDLERRAAHHGLPYTRAPYPVDTRQTERVGRLAAEEDWCADFTRAVIGMNFTGGPTIGTPGALEAAVERCGRDPARVLAAAADPRIAALLEEDTARARELGVFGSPSFTVNGELFWGDDRLEDALACASARV